MIQQYLQQRTPRERILLYTMAGLLLVILFYSLIIEPVMQSRAEMEEVVSRTRESYNRIRVAAAEASKLRSGGARATNRSRQGTQSLMGQIEQSAREKGLAEQLKRMQPSGKSDISVWFEKSRFDTLLAWLSEMEHRYGLEVKSLEIERVDPGRVNARVMLGA